MFNFLNVLSFTLIRLRLMFVQKLHISLMNHINYIYISVCVLFGMLATESFSDVELIRSFQIGQDITPRVILLI